MMIAHGCTSWHARCTPAARWRPPIRVLIAEDDPRIRSLVAEIVTDLGHAPTCACNGQEALRLFDDGAVDVVISDLLMPGLDGIHFCEEVRSRVGAPYTYFILLTALSDPEHRLAGVQAGADDYLAKPCSLEDLEARLIAAARVTDVHRRQEALLRISRRFAAESDPGQLVHELLQEAIELVGGSAGVVTRWDDERRRLEAVSGTTPMLRTWSLSAGEGASGRAAEARAPVFVNRVENGMVDPILARAGMDSAVAVPLIHESRLVGTLAVASDRADASGPKRFTHQDAELLEMLASTAAAALVALEHARLDGVMLAARTAQHELNNQLAVARGFAEILVGAPDLPPHLQDVAAEVMTAADDAAGIVRQLRNISQIREQHWNEPGDTTINLAQSQHHHHHRGAA